MSIVSALKKSHFFWRLLAVDPQTSPGRSVEDIHGNVHDMNVFLLYQLLLISSFREGFEVHGLIYEFFKAKSTTSEINY